MIIHVHLMLGWVWRAGKLTSSVTVAQVGKTPHVPQSYAVSDAGEQELVLAPPLLPGQRGGLDGDGARRLTLWQRDRSRGTVAILCDGVPVQVR